MTEKERRVRTSTARIHARTPENVALAYFANAAGVSDSIWDLCSAGFDAEYINIALPVAEEAASRNPDSEPLPNAIGVHSFRWLLGRMRGHDRHRQGADQMSGLDPAPGEGDNPTCSTLNLETALEAMGVEPTVIALLRHDTRSYGTYVLVDAADRVAEATLILNANAGYMRTEYLKKPTF